MQGEPAGEGRYDLDGPTGREWKHLRDRLIPIRDEVFRVLRIQHLAALLSRLTSPAPR
jgi:hypothetical protein